MPFVLFGLWFVIANAVGFNLMYKDKVSAENGGRRVKERSLFITAALLGAVSIYASMYALRHKLRKYYFKYGMIILVVENMLLILTFILLMAAFYH